MGKKYILQYGQIAGISYYSAIALRDMGIESWNVIPVNSDNHGTDLANFDRQLPFDKTLVQKSTGKIIRVLSKTKFALHAVANCSLVHYYSNTILKNIDSSLFSYLKIPMIISWAGGDARIISLARKNNPYFYRMPDDHHDDRIKRRLELVSKYVHYVATDPEMAEYSVPYFDKVYIIYQPINLKECFYKLPVKQKKTPVILHIPTHREVKGTVFVESAIERLRAEGLSFDFKVLRPNLTQKQVREKISEADIYVDELRCGSYGITCVESMASGKPTITYIREDLVEKYPTDLPVVNANPDTIYAKLKELILDGELRSKIGFRSRKYVEKYHALESVGPRLKQIYNEIGWRI